MRSQTKFLTLLSALSCSLGLAHAQSSQARLLSMEGGRPQVLFWMSNGSASVDSFLAHKNKIGILSPTWYQIDEGGLVSGEPQPVVLKAAHEAHVTLLPLFALFNPEKSSPVAERPTRAGRDEPGFCPRV